MRWKLLALTVLICLSISLIAPSTAEADAPGKGDTMLGGYTSKQNSGLKMGLGSSVWLPHLNIDFYSGESQYEWHILINGNVNRSGDFQDGPWESVEMDLPQGNMDFELQIGHHSYEFNPVVSSSLGSGDDPAIEDGPTIVEYTKSTIMNLKWVHVAYGGLAGISGIFMAMVIHNYQKAEKYGELVP